MSWLSWKASATSFCVRCQSCFVRSTEPEATNLFEVNAKDLGKELLLGRLGVPEHQDPKGRTWLEEVLG